MRDPQDAAILDSLLDRLRSGDTMPRKARRTRPSIHRLPVALTTMAAAAAEAGEGNGARAEDRIGPAEVVADKAKDMLAQLQQAGYGAPVSPGMVGTLPRTPRAGSTRRARARAEARASASNLQVHAEEEMGTLSDTWTTSLPSTPGMGEGRAHSRSGSLAQSVGGMSDGDVRVNVKSPTELGSVRSSVGPEQ